jgi:glycosyltransferase involved in cell wall biosynthesis
MKLISIVIPFYNEEECTDLFFEKLYLTLNNIENYNFELICVNDGSRDKTLELLKKHQEQNPEIRIVNLTRNFGHESAVAAGLSIATGDAIIPMDADLQDPPSVIPELINKWEEGFDVVNAKRSDRKKDSFLKRKTASIFYKLISKWSGKTRVPQNVGHFRLITRKVLEQVIALDDVTRVFRVEVPFVGYKTTTVEYARPEREKGHTHYNYKSMIDLASDSIVITSAAPLRIIFKITIALGIITLLSIVSEVVFFILYLCNIKLGFTDMTLLVWLILNVICLLSTLMMLSLSLISEYVGKTFKEIQHRPFFLIDEVIESNNKSKKE